MAIAPLLTRKLGSEELSAPLAGTLIFHPSPLPYGRGASSIRWAYRRHEPITAATWFWANDELDGGDICEQEIVGRMEGVTISRGWGVSFATILSQHGETLHNHRHDGIITPGKLLLVDAGAESNTHYASDFTRTVPCGGKFSPVQRDIYDIVVACNDLAYDLAKPGVTYRDVHLAVAARMLKGGGRKRLRK